MISIDRRKRRACCLFPTQEISMLSRRLNALPLKQKLLLCLFAYLCGITLAWLVDI